MKNTEEIRKAMVSADTKEITEILEILDKNSRVLVRSYITALADKLELEKTKLAAV